MLVIRDKSGAELRVACSTATQHATNAENRATANATNVGETAGKHPPVLKSRAQQHGATAAQPRSTGAQLRGLLNGDPSEAKSTVANCACPETQHATVQQLTQRARQELGWTDADVHTFITDDMVRGGSQWALSALAEVLALVQREHGRRPSDAGNGSPRPA